MSTFVSETSFQFKGSHDDIWNRYSKEKKKKKNRENHISERHYNLHTV